jgi:hypothetical protein
MESIDLEDFIEEVKFQMTEYDVLEEDTILAWEKRFREYVRKQKGNRNLVVKSEEDIFIKVKGEEVMEQIALEYYRSFKTKDFDGYWKKFKI